MSEGWFDCDIAIPNKHHNENENPSEYEIASL
jgi:hypothetical protein